MNAHTRIIGALAVALATPALALGGTVTGTAYLDRNSNGTFDTAAFTPGAGGVARGGDSAVSGVTVNAYDSAGALVGTATTAPNGAYSLTTTATGTVRVEFTTPSGYQPSFRGARNGTSIQFVNATASGVDFGLVKPSDYCQDNPGLVTCMFPIADSQTAMPSEAGGFMFPATLAPDGLLAMTSGGRVDDTNGGTYSSTATTVATGRAIGATFGVGVDRSRNVFFGSYVKRHSEYGLDGSGNPRLGLNIYRVNTTDASRPTTLAPWVTLGSATMPAHSAANPSFVVNPANDFPYAADGNRSLAPGQTGYSDVYTKVGRAGLGDVDVAPDGSRLYAIEMTEGSPRFWEVPINGSGPSVTPGTPAPTALSAPSTFNGVPCKGNWHPMGIGVRDGDVLIGGVCGGEGELNPLPVKPTTFSVASGVVTITTATPHELGPGDYVQVSSLYTNANGAQLVTAVTSTTFTYTSSAATAPIDTGSTSAPSNAFITPNIAGGRFTARSRSGNVATITTTAPHGLAVGDWVTTSNVGGSGYAGLVRVSAVTTNTFSYASTGADEASVAITAGSAKRETAPVAAFVQRRNGSGGFDTIAAIPLGYPKASSNGLLKQFGGGTGFEWELGTQTFSGMWRTWTDVPPTANYTNMASNPPNFTASPGTDAGSFGQPMLANIEIMDDGSLVLALRDRYMDQVSPSDTLNYERSSETLLNQGQGVAELIKVCNSSGTYSMEVAGACGGDQGAGANGGTPIITGTGMTAAMRDPSALYYWNAFWGTAPALGSNSITHAYTGLGGVATMPGNPTLWSTSYDIDAANQQGVKAFGPCAGGGTCGPSPAANGAIIGGTGFRSSLATSATRYAFKKGNGLGDLELVCDSAPVEIGNRVWIDTNANGIQDPGESPVQGITVRLYNASNTLVGTAITDASGEYYFDSNVSKPAAGDGSHVGGGLVVGEAFTIRLDKPEDYYTGSGPLAPYALTAARQTSPGSGSQSTAVDSTADIVSSYPQITVPSRLAGFNNHTYDVGFVASGSPGWPQPNSGGGGSGGSGSGGGGSGGGGSGSGGADAGGSSSNGAATVGGSSSSGGGSSTVPVIDPTAASTGAKPSSSGLQTGRTSRVIIRTNNRRGTTTPSMRTIIRIPAGVEVVSAPGGTILANSVSFTSTNVRSGSGATYVLYLRPLGRGPTIRMPVVVSMTSPVTITRSTITLRVKRGNPLLPAVAG